MAVQTIRNNAASVGVVAIRTLEVAKHVCNRRGLSTYEGDRSRLKTLSRGAAFCNSPLTSSASTPMTGSRVLELGAGMSGLAGLGVAACSDAAEVVITDGNPDALKNLEVRTAAGVRGHASA